jgi:hypothetical protein
MSTPKVSPAPARPAAPPPAAPAPGPVGAWVNFWFAAIDPVGLHVLRVLGGALFLFWLLPFAGDHQALFGLGGWFDAEAYREASRLRGLPPHEFGWSLTYLCGTSAAALTAVYWLSVVAILLFTLGLAPRITGVLTWVAVVSYTANPALDYDADPLLKMLAFYLMVGYLLAGLRRPGQSWLARLLGPREAWLFGRAEGPPAESVGANVALRLFQVHFAIAMVASGLHKLQIKEWWDGLAPWFYVNAPYHTTEVQVRSFAPQAGTWLVLFSLFAYLTLAWQIGFPAFAWRKGVWRVVSLGGALFAWLACAFWVPLPLFGPLLVVACLAYLTPAEWRRWQGRAARLPGVPAVLRRLSGAQAEPALAGPKGGLAARISTASVGQHS